MVGMNHAMGRLCITFDAHYEAEISLPDGAMHGIACIVE
jgi:hypothetical protein